MQLIDTHCHLYLDAFDNDRDTVIKRAIELGVDRFYLPAIDNRSHAAMLAMETAYPNNCMAMMGLHPCSVNEKVEEELQIVQDWLTKRKFVAIGEIGLDYYWDKTFAQQQQEAFNKQMQWALDHQLPIVIHTRNAMQETINMVKPFAAKGLKGIFHCFSGSVESATQIIKMGFLLGIGGVITYPKAGLAEALVHIDLEHLVLETDSPYLTPVPFRGKRNESSYISYIAAKLAATKNCSVEQVASITSANAKKLFG